MNTFADSFSRVVCQYFTFPSTSAGLLLLLCLVQLENVSMLTCSTKILTVVNVFSRSATSACRYHLALLASDRQNHERGCGLIQNGVGTKRLGG